MKPKRDKEFYERMNRIAEALASSELSQNDGKFCWVLFRKTFMYGKYEDKVSRFQFSLMTGILETHISDAKKRLKERHIIYENGKIKGFNLNTDQWEKVQLSGPFKKVQLSGQKGPARAEKKGPAIGTYKETTKKTLQRKEKVVSQPIKKKGEVPEGLKKLRVDIDHFKGRNK